jgi:phosphatidylserine/phosphatidylglycerophosphate/cardiolipin synthase-like enzyme
MYEFQQEGLAQLLIQARARGVSVSAIMDPSEASSQSTWEELRQAGIPVVAFPVEPMSIDHVKLLIVDARLAIVGGINWGLNSPINRDYDALVRGPVVDNLEHVFTADLQIAGIASPLAPTEADPLIDVVATTPQQAIDNAVLAGVNGAHRFIDIEMYVLSDQAVIAALANASLRGLRVRVLLDPNQPQNMDAMKLLQSAHAQASLFPVKPHQKLHAKVGVFDGQLVVFGSCNWSRSGFFRNHELDLAIHDSQVAAIFEQSMQRDWAAVH